MRITFLKRTNTTLQAFGHSSYGSHSRDREALQQHAWEHCLNQ
jgi:hypothetical protein